ncbi:ankyrin repeat and LEM domain-containing protein 2 homolog [Portunus trituberculatus]|uniref:ankyrin repeat and LEM domain-containing protein 2 homolog n=1 Tax=Portunus trituberculatus TaxID=210409 RepID=UPI001E1D1E01|nr:ankyrin repeat and LEM domain-containing protein 2 homolog [Portunus trituberculatus]XP_045124039.1 ankyrin repeat and LEM domain-containing protein 2 homolog [Portunus trituberculatus]XP_045124041.1 ankyrin repeat and LEM domain-containing protein 2 homolog [Portunus trituberculatus]
MEQQQQQAGEVGKVSWTSAAASPMTLPEKTQKVFPEDNSVARVEAEVYYGIALPEGEGLEEGDIKRVFVDKTECLAAMKKYRGSRFKAFRMYEDALKFSEAGATTSQGGTGEEGAITPQPLLNVEKPSPYRGPKSQDLVKFRKSIEKGDFDYFTRCMMENPRYLVSSGDTPAVLQEGFRYNALHVACRTNRPAFAQRVLSQVSQPMFFQRLYPDDTIESATRRSAFLVDLYLNTPDKGFNETPLHFASKHGSVECVRVLAGFKGCDTTRLNKYGQTAAEIAGSRMKEPSNAAIEEIREAMGDKYYVPLLKDDDLYLLPHVGSPWSPQMDSPNSPLRERFLTSSPISVASASPISPSLKVRGVAGPMSCSQAENFHRLWKSATSSSLSTTPSPARLERVVRPASLRVTDHEKGLERAGRNLAAEQKVGWQEYWDFLGTFVNLASDEGLGLLEWHLKRQTNDLRMAKEKLSASELAAKLKEALKQPDEDDIVPLMRRSQHEKSMSGVSQASWLSQASGSPLAQLCRGLEALRLNASLSPQGDLPQAACSKFLSSLEQQLSPGCGSPQGCDEPEGVPGLVEQVSYVLKSVEVSAGRLSEALREVALDLQASVAASLGMNRTLRAKLRSEVACLRSIVARAVAELGPGGMDLGFVHPLVAGRAVLALWQGAAPADVASVTQAMRRIVSHMDLVPLDSSDEDENEGGGGRHFEAPQHNTRGDTHHLACVLRCLDVALQAATNTSDGITSPEVPQLGQCHCPWNDGSHINRVTSAQATVPASALERERAKAYLQKALQGKGKQCDPVVRHLSFTQEEGEEEEEIVVRATMGVKDGFTMSQGAANTSESRDSGGGDGGQEELEPGARSPDSFTSAASSLDEEMCTPEEGPRVFIGGAEPSKMDVDVLDAVGDQLVNQQKYPHVFQWQLLVKSFSKDERGSLASPFCRRGRRRVTPGGGIGEQVASPPSSLSSYNTPRRSFYSRRPASTPRILFRPL